MLNDGNVQETTNDFGYNSMLAREKDGQWGVCVNHKPLSKATAKQKFLVARIGEFLDRIEKLFNSHF